MRSERVYSLARELMSKPANFANTLSDQWAERTLDDSAIRSKHPCFLLRGYVSKPAQGFCSQGMAYNFYTIPMTNLHVRN